MNERERDTHEPVGGNVNRSKRISFLPKRRGVRSQRRSSTTRHPEQVRRRRSPGQNIRGSHSSGKKNERVILRVEEEINDGGPEGGILKGEMGGDKAPERWQVTLELSEEVLREYGDFLLSENVEM